MSELDQFLETPEAEVAQSEVQAEAKTTDDKGTNSAEMPAATKDESADANGKKHWSESAYHDEKRKRQELAAEKQRLEEQLAALTRPRQEEVDLFVDPKGFTQGLKNELRGTLLNERINLSRELLIETKQDYADKEAKFVELATANPVLIDKMNASANPAKFAYETAAAAIAQEAKLKLVDEIGDIDAYKEKLKQEILAELNAGKSGKAYVDRAPSLATASAARGNNDPSAPLSLKDLFQR